MGSSEAEGSSPPAMAAVIDELIKGHQSVATLATLLFGDPLQSPTAKLLLEKITSSISKAIAVLESGKSGGHMEAQVDSPSSDVTSKAPRRNKVVFAKVLILANQMGFCNSTYKFGDNYALLVFHIFNLKSSLLLPSAVFISLMAYTVFLCLACRGNPYSWTRVTSASIEDGHTWRKYGQKEIFSAKHPRSYFRCTYKYDRGCKATRQVQKSEDNPFLYVITYFGEHTCEGAKENSPRCREPCVISFESNKVNGINQEIPFSSFPSHKQENEEEVVSNLTSSDSPSNCFEPPDMELQKPSMIGLEPEMNDSLPGLDSSITSFDPEFMDLEEMLSFDQNDFFIW